MHRERLNQYQALATYITAEDWKWADVNHHALADALQDVLTELLASGEEDKETARILARCHGCNNDPCLCPVPPYVSDAPTLAEAMGEILEYRERVGEVLGRYEVIGDFEKLIRIAKWGDAPMRALAYGAVLQNIERMVQGGN